MKILNLIHKQQQRIISIMDRAICTIGNTRRIFLENMMGNKTHHETTEFFIKELKELLRFQTYSSRDNQRQEDIELINKLTPLQSLKDK